MRSFVISLLLVSNITIATDEVTPLDTTLSESEQKLIDWVDARHSDILAELKTHVDINTGTANIAGLNDYRELLAKDLSALGFDTKTVSSDPIPVLGCQIEDVQIADHLVASRQGTSSKRLLVNGHMDTVFSKNDEFQSLQVLEDGTLKGPGVADMKGGIVIMLNALRALHAQGLLQKANMTVLLNSDEEIGSLGSRALIEELAQKHDVGLVFEGSYQNLVTRARKGLGQARLKITGREAHAGGAHQEGVSANLELAHKIIAIEKLTDYQRKMTVNTGVMSGGEKRNTVPGCADAYIDLRFPSEKEGEELVESIRAIASSKTMANSKFPDLPKVEAWAVLHRPAKEENAAVDALISEAMGLSVLIGEPIVGTRYSGGGTDGSIAQAVGLPTMDSLGMDGLGAHSTREESTVKSLIARTKLAAIMLARQIEK